MYNVRSLKHGFTIKDEEGRPIDYSYRKAQQAIEDHCARYEMDPKEFQIIPARKTDDEKDRSSFAESPSPV